MKVLMEFEYNYTVQVQDVIKLVDIDSGLLEASPMLTWRITGYFEDYDEALEEYHAMKQDNGFVRLVSRTDWKEQETGSYHRV